MLMDGVSRLLLLFSLLSGDDVYSQNKYAVVFDAGSTGSRVHVFSFDNDMTLLPIGQDYEFYLAIKPGLSSYEKDPIAGAESLRPLLEQAEAVVPQQLRSITPLKLGATAGLRQLQGNAAEDILDAVRELFSESSLNYKAERVSLLEGTDEGVYMWVAVNYLLGKFGGKYSDTVAVIDLGGGSVQMSYALSDKAAAAAPVAGDNTSYVFDKVVIGNHYNLYVHSFLNYGLMAARAQSLKLSGAGNPCVTNGYKDHFPQSMWDIQYEGTYEYTGEVYKVSPPRSGTSLIGCLAHARKVLKLDAPCPHKNCSFDGVWNGGGGDGFKNLYAASYFYDIAVEAGILESDANSAILRPRVYLKAAKKACSANVDNIKTLFPQIYDSDVPFLCMDLVYEYTLLVQAFGIKPTEEITVVQNLEYKGSLIGAAWPLGCGIDVLSAA